MRTTKDLQPLTAAERQARGVPRPAAGIAKRRQPRRVPACVPLRVPIAIPTQESLYRPGRVPIPEPRHARTHVPRHELIAGPRHEPLHERPSVPIHEPGRVPIVGPRRLPSRDRQGAVVSRTPEFALNLCLTTLPQRGIIASTALSRDSRISLQEAPARAPI